MGFIVVMSRGRSSELLLVRVVMSRGRSREV